MPHATEDTFHLGLKALIRNSLGQILLLKVDPNHLRNNRDPYWDIPGGRIHRGEAPATALAREVAEETGLDLSGQPEPFAMVLSNIRIPLGSHGTDSQPHPNSHSGPLTDPDVGLILSIYICPVADSATIRLSHEHTDYHWYEPSDAAALLQVKYPIEFTDQIRNLQSVAGQRTANIGCEAYIVRRGQLLLGLRKNVFGAGTWALPGGHLEFMSRADATVARELAEETGLLVDPVNLSLLALTDDLDPDKRSHYIHLTFAADIGDQEPQLREPEACAEWRWFSLRQLPDNIFPPHQKILANLASPRSSASQPKSNPR